MSEGMFEKTEEGANILRRLGLQFGANLTTALSINTDAVNRVELKGRCVSSVGTILRDECATNSTHREIATIYDEVFADCICSVYLAAQGLDKPAQLVLRRVLELGLAAIYLWDIPHAYWAWKEYDKDLSFTEITDQLSAPAYLRYVAAMNSQDEASPICNVTLARTEYRALSNTVHGKITTFETTIAARFQHSDVDWQMHISRVEGIQDLIIDAARGRFSTVKEKLPQLQPQLATLL
jgi:hypothetical protein